MFSPFDGCEQSSEFLRSILESIQDGVYFVDPARRITYWNAAAESITGYLRHEILGRCCTNNLLRHRTPEGVDLCETGCPLQTTLRDGRPRESFVLLRHKQGHIVPVRVRMTAVRDSNGVVLGAAEVFEEHDFVNPEARRIQTLDSLRLVDKLTGLANHEMIAAKLKERISELAAYRIPFGVLLIDIDRLDHINRNFGRDAGDGILRMAAHTLAKSVAVEHLLGRWENDRFLAIVDNCDPTILASIGERLRAMMANSSIEWWGEPVRVTVSVAGVIAQSDEDEASLIARAGDLLTTLLSAGGDGFLIG